MPGLYTAIAQSNGFLEIQGLEYKFESCSPINEQATVGAPYWNPNNNRNTSLAGRPEFQPMTAVLLLSKEQFLLLDELYTSSLAKSTSLTAYHRIGEIETILTGVRLTGLEYGAFDRLSNDAAKVTLTFTYEGREAQTTGGTLQEVPA